MHLRRGSLLLMLMLALLGASNAKAQWTPVTAKIRETIEITQNGQRIKTETKEGTFLRNRDGSTLTHWMRVNGKEELGGSGELTDNKALRVYQVNLKTKQAIQIGEFTEPEKPDQLQNLAASPLGDDFVEGIRCRKARVVLVWLDRRKEPVGESCESIEYALTLRKDVKATQGGITRHAVTEMYDIKLGVDPDSELFDVSRHFTVFRPEPRKSNDPK